MGSHRYLAASGSELWCWQPSSSSSSSINDDHSNGDDTNDNDNSYHYSSSSSTSISTSGEIVHHTLSEKNPTESNEFILVRDFHSVIWDVKMNCDQSCVFTGSADGVLRYTIHPLSYSHSHSNTI